MTAASKIKTTAKLLRNFGLNDTLKIILFRYYKKMRLRFADLSRSNVVRVNGYQLVGIPNDEGISAELSMFGTHEPITTNLLSSELKDGMVCLDIGANIGYYVFLESNLVGSNGKVIAIEPSPMNFEGLKRNLELQNKSNIEIYNFACGNEDREVSFLTSNISNWSRINENDASSLYTDNIVSEAKIPLRTIDSFVNERRINKLDLVRFDTEGYELQIYEGMRQTIRKFKPLLCLEIHSFILGLEGTTRLLKDLQNDGYEIKYYVPRCLDMPWIGKMRHVKNFSIDEVIKKVAKDSVPFGVFEAFLVNKE